MTLRMSGLVERSSPDLVERGRQSLLGRSRTSLVRESRQGLGGRNSLEGWKGKVQAILWFSNKK